MGDRSTTYKYLNHHVVAVITTAAAPLEAKMSHTCGVQLLDSVKGSILYSTELSSSKKDCGLQLALVDNWLVYYHLDDALKAADGSKGHRLVTVELYEGDGPDDDLGR